MKNDKHSPFQSPWRYFFILGLGVFMSTLDSSIVNVVLPEIRGYFHADLHKVGWIPLSYLLTITVFLLVFGQMGDRLGRTKIYRTGLLIFTLGSFLCGVAPTLLILVLSRVVQALGAGMIMAIGPALLVDIFPANMRGRAIGAIGVVVNIGLTSGPLLGGLITNALSWRFIFLVNLPFGVATWWMARRLEQVAPPKEDPSVSKKVDLAGAGLWCAALIILVLGLNRLPVWGFTFWPTGCLFLAGIIALTFFLFQERRASAPILPLELFRTRLFNISLLGGTILFVYTFIIVYLGPFYLSVLAGLPVNMVGAFYILAPLGSMMTAPISGRLYDKWGSRGLTAFGISVNCAALFGFSSLGAEPSLILFGFLMLTLGLGNGIFMPPNTSALLGIAPRAYAGSASGLLATGRNLGMLIGVAIGGSIFEMVYRYTTNGDTITNYDTALHAQDFAGAWQAALWAGLLVCLISFFFNLLRGRESKRLRG